MTTKHVMVLVDGLHGLDSVAAAVEAGGAHVERVMRSMKTLICAIDDDPLIERVRRMDGVASAREKAMFSLPPMDADIPQ